jgi:hypothetical protein
MHKIIYFSKCGTGFDMLKADEYRTDDSIILEPHDECLIILLNSQQRVVKFDQLFFRGHEFIICNKKPHQLCVLLRNLSSTLSFQIQPGCTLEKILEKSTIAYKLCHINQKDLFHAEMVAKNYHGQDTGCDCSSRHRPSDVKD